MYNQSSMKQEKQPQISAQESNQIQTDKQDKYLECILEENPVKQKIDATGTISCREFYTANTHAAANFRHCWGWRDTGTFSTGSTYLPE